MNTDIARAQMPRRHQTHPRHQRQNSSPRNSGNGSYGAWNLFSGFFATPNPNPGSPTSSVSSTSLQSVDPVEFVVDSCQCCGNVIKYPSNIQKYRCVFCGICCVTCNYDYTSPAHGIRTLESRADPVSFESIKLVADNCFREFKSCVDTNGNSPGNPALLQRFKPLEDLLFRSFSSADSLNSSFKLSKDAPLRHSNPNINFKELHETFKLILSLPVKKPFFVLLTAASTLLHNPPQWESAADLKWLLIFLELPTLSHCLYPPRPPSVGRVHPNIVFFESKEVRTVSLKITEKVIGYLANLNTSLIEYFINWLSRLSEVEFRRKVDFVNLYITHNLRTLMNTHQVVAQDNPDFRANANNNTNNNTNNNNNNNTNNAANDKGNEQPSSRSSPRLPLWSSKRSRKTKKLKLKVSQYGSDWHLKSGCKLLSFFYEVFNCGKSDFSFGISAFYNSLVDLINIKHDFDAWQTLSGKRSTTKTELTVNDMFMTIDDYLQTAEIAPLSPTGTRSRYDKLQFAFCQFPFILSLAAKIAIIEYEAKRQMSKKAEEAFLHAVSKKTIVEIYFKVRVRREFITNDSLRCIKDNLNNLKKSLKVEFVGEPGVDAGGLKKEWFLLLTKKLFDPANGLFEYVDQSNYLWFTLNADTNESLELYYLVGVVLGLALYNSTILDLHFPPALYKLLLDQEVTFNDFLKIYPETGANLKKLESFNPEQFQSVFDGIFCELTYKTSFDEVKTVDLMPNGSSIPVTVQNRKAYVKLYSHFYLYQGIKSKVEAFTRGFKNVISGNAFSLFAPQEIELLLCGGDDVKSKYDLKSLQTVTKYNGFIDHTDVMHVPIVQWFWEFFEELSISQQKKLMFFITGSDRVPATGIVSMNFKVTRLGTNPERLPIAHTCFNEICLYDYPSKEVLTEKLTLAMMESEGFGIK